MLLTVLFLVSANCFLSHLCSVISRRHSFNYFANYASLSFNFFLVRSFSFSPLSLHRLFSISSYRTPVFCIVDTCQSFLLQKEYVVPEQFKTKFNGKKLVTAPTDIAS